MSSTMKAAYLPGNSTVEMRSVGRKEVCAIIARICAGVSPFTRRRRCPPTGSGRSCSSSRATQISEALDASASTGLAAC